MIEVLARKNRFEIEVEGVKVYLPFLEANHIYGSLRHLEAFLYYNGLQTDGAYPRFVETDEGVLVQYDI